MTKKFLQRSSFQETSGKWKEISFNFTNKHGREEATLEEMGSKVYWLPQERKDNGLQGKSNMNSAVRSPREEDPRGDQQPGRRELAGLQDNIILA